VLSTTSPRRCTVAIATIQPGAGSPRASVARSFRAAKGFVDRVIGIAAEKDAARLRAADLSLWNVLSAPPPEDGAAFVERLSELRSRCPVDVLLPARSADTIAFLSIEKDLAAIGVRTFLPTAAQLELLRTAARPPGHPTGGGAQNGAYAVAAVGDGEGSVAGLVALRKIDAEGQSQRWVGVAAQDAALQERVLALVRQTRLRGPVEIDLLRDPSGEYQFVRVEPRFPAWVHLFASPGPNLPAILVRLALGEAVESQATLPGGPLLVGAAWEAWMTHD